MADTDIPRIHKYQDSVGDPLPFAVGDKVTISGHYVWCGDDTYGELGQVVEITRYPANIVAGGAIFSVQRTTSHGDAWGGPVPMVSSDLTAREG